MAMRPYDNLMYANQGLKARILSVPKNPLAGHSAHRCGIFLGLAPPITEKILNQVQNDVLKFGIFRDASGRRMPLKSTPDSHDVLKKRHSHLFVLNPPGDHTPPTVIV
jgi:hypothetical protein